MTQVPNNLSKIFPPGSDQVAQTLFNQICMKIMVALAMTGGQDENGNPTVLSNDYEVHRCHPRCALTKELPSNRCKTMRTSLYQLSK